MASHAPTNLHQHTAAVPEHYRVHRPAEGCIRATRKTWPKTSISSNPPQVEHLIGVAHQPQNNAPKQQYTQSKLTPSPHFRRWHHNITPSGAKPDPRPILPLTKEYKTDSKFYNQILYNIQSQDTSLVHKHNILSSNTLLIVITTYVTIPYSL
jgi:hypothetical protein